MSQSGVLPDLKGEQEPYIRLLVCRTCKTIDEIPSFDGPPDADTLLQITVERHGEEHSGLLYNVAELHWRSDTMREEIKKQITAGGSSGLDVFGTNFYATRMQFSEDAMSCWKAHLKPKGQCPDYGKAEKRLLPDTDKDRRDAGMKKTKDSAATKVFLCQFCPVHSYNVTRQREKAGMYS